MPREPFKPTDPGFKKDTGKNRLGMVLGGFAEAIEQVGEVGTIGARKYVDGGWLHQPNGQKRYLDAMLRHLFRDMAGETTDPESNMSHKAHVAWNALAYLQLSINDQRGVNSDGLQEMPSMQGNESTHRVLSESSDKERLHLQSMLSESAKELPPCTTGEDPIKHLQQRITTWADRIIPNRTATGALTKLMLHEIPELLNGGLDDPYEYADVLILVLDIASLKGIDAVQAAHDKMAINEQRLWATDPETGLIQHIKGSGGDEK